MSSRPVDKDLAKAEAKLQRPTKQSAFEKQRADAEAKRARDAAETQAALAEFERSFDGDGAASHFKGRNSSAFDDRGRFGHNDASHFSSGPAPGAGKRHFSSSTAIGGSLKSGPGSLGPVPDSYGHKRPLHSQQQQQQRRHGQHGPDSRRQGWEDREGTRMSMAKAFEDPSDEEEEEDTADSRNRAREKAVAKPTLRLANLPPGISQAAVKALIPEALTVEGVNIQSVQSSGTDRRSAVAIVTFSQETPVANLEAAVSSLQNEYLGYGYYLSLHRHLSSAVSHAATLNKSGSSTSSRPFGAKPVAPAANTDDSNVHQRGPHRGFAPPSSYAPTADVNRSQLLHVSVKAPEDVRTLRLIHQVIQGMMEHGPDFEALLMSRPEVQKDVKWAWIWDARSEGGLWYRWKLWEIITGATSAADKFVPFFEDMPAWKRPETSLPFEYATSLKDLTADADYDSSDDEDMEEQRGEHVPGEEADKRFLNPLHKAKLTHLLARLPPTHLKIRKGDVARVTAFAIMHATRGVDEVVDMVVSNIEKPFSLTAANPKWVPPTPQKKESTGKENADDNGSEGPDVSAACLVGLYIIHDILSSSATNSMPRTWRYRQLFETALRDRKVFETLGMMADKCGWGRLRAEKWKRSVLLVLNQWKAHDLFPTDSHEYFVKTFEKPPSLQAELKTEEAVNAKKRWKALETLPVSEKPDDSEAASNRQQVDEDDAVGEPLPEEDDEDAVGEPLEEDEDAIGQPIEDDDDEDAVGEPIQDEADDDVTMQDDVGSAPVEGAGGRLPPRKRMRAVDLFAGSDESDS